MWLVEYLWHCSLNAIYKFPSAIQPIIHDDVIKTHSASHRANNPAVGFMHEGHSSVTAPQLFSNTGHVVYMTVDEIQPGAFSTPGRYSL